MQQQQDPKAVKKELQHSSSLLQYQNKVIVSASQQALN